MTKTRGRPAHQMTHRRQQVLQVLADQAVEGRRVSWAEIARRCGLYDYRDARRIARDLNQMGTVDA